MTKRKKHIYAAVLLLGGLALLAERFTGGDRPAPAQAGQAIPGKANAATPENGAAPSSPTDVLLSPARFPEGLPDFAPPARDPFEPTAEVRRRLMQVPAAAEREAAQEAAAERQAAEAPPPESSSAWFPRRHQLSAVVSAGALRVAIIDGRWMRQGQEVDGCRLIAIEGDRVVLGCPDGEVVLSVAPSLTGNGGHGSSSEGN